MLTINTYRKVESLEEAYVLNQKRSSCIIGGMLWLKMGRRQVQTAIDLSGLGLDEIEETAEEFRIGCMTSLRALETHTGLAQYTDGAMADALHGIVGVQFRNLATVGGSIWGRYGFSDVLTVFLAMNSFVELYHGGLVPLAQFAQQAPNRDILVRVIVKKEPMRLCYQSVRNQAKTDFPVLTCAASKTAEGVFRLAIGARPGRAVLVENAEGTLPVPDDAVALAERFAAHARATVKTEGNLRGTAAYRTHLVGVLTRRAVMALANA